MTVLFDVYIPYNAKMVLLAILQLVGREFVDTSSITGLMFDWRETDAYSTSFDEEGFAHSRFADAGYESTIFIELLGTLFLMVLLQIFLTILIIVCKKIAKSCNENCFTRCLRKKVHYKIIVLRFFLEGCVELGLSAFI